MNPSRSNSKSNSNSNSTKSRIREILAKKGPISGSDLARILGVTRQAVHRHLKKLVEEGAVRCDGATRAAVYSLSSGRSASPSVRRTSRTFHLEGLQEDKVYRDWVETWFSSSRVSAQARTILNYAFTEMLNNAVDHSESEKCVIHLAAQRYQLQFRIRDYGIGIFQSIATKLQLENENEALRMLLQGKTTTMPDRHSGEGIFFTSRAVDQFTIRSHRLLIRFDSTDDNVVVEEKKIRSGTEIHATISRRSRRRLQDIFGKYAPEDYDYRFSKTEVHVRLHRSDCISRSEARRLLTGLEKFRVVALDFRGVKQLGQGFADEIFRVWQTAHPDVHIEIRHLSPALAQLVSHVVDK